MVDAIADSFGVQVRVGRSMAVSCLDTASPRDHGQKDRGGDTEPEFKILTSAEHC